MSEPVVIDADAVLFDSDGVLVDSHEQVGIAWSRLAEEFDLDIARLLAELAGVPARQTLARHLDGAALDAAVARLEDLEVDTSDGTAPIAGARELVAALPDGAFAFVTSATRRLAVARWTAAGFEIPANAITADDVTRGKPHPEPFLAGAALLGVDPTRCVVFEDSDAGGAAARAAGSTVVAVGGAPWSGAAAARVPDLADVHIVPGRGSHAWTVHLGGTGAGPAGLA